MKSMLHLANAQLMAGQREAFVLLMEIDRREANIVFGQQKPSIPGLRRVRVSGFALSNATFLSRQSPNHT
jgi:hypothetical protein